MTKPIDMRGVRCNTLIVLRRKYPEPANGDRTKVRQARWICRCLYCGASKEAYGQNLRKGAAKCHEHTVEIRCEQSPSPAARKPLARPDQLQHPPALGEGVFPQNLRALPE